MVQFLFLLMLVLPIVEVYLLVWIGHATDIWVPFAIVITSMLAGTLVTRWQGLRVFRRVRDDARSGRMPADAFVDGFLILLAGVLLIIPGVLTDIVGIALLIPPLRALMKLGAKAWLQRHVEVRVGPAGATLWETTAGPKSVGQDEIIDARVISSRVEDVRP